ncbi:MAG: MaoC family dehydratase [Hyphomicrobiaceae bacterium]
MLDIPVPRDKIHLEDVEIGRTISFGRLPVSKDDIIAFAKAYDPQPIHLDEEAAKKSMVGGLCASGFHTCALMMRMLADDLLAHATSLGSPGIDEVRWLKPVRPGDVLSARLVAHEKRVLASRPEVGMARLKYEMLNQKGEVLMTWDTNQFLKVRHPSPGTSAGSGAEKRPRFESLWEMAGPEPVRTANHFEDRVVGETYSLGEHTFTRKETIGFARQFDPQAFHLDDAAAKASLFGALSASGWHTAAIWIRQFVRFRQEIEARMRSEGLRPAEYGPSPGFKNLRWIKPVLPGDTIEFRGRIIEKRDWKSRPDRGLIVTENQGRNQKGEVVFGIVGQILAERRVPLTT